jgi:hypothetical protein
MPYDLYLDLYWLYVIEYADRDSQTAFNGTLTLDGYRQGGLGYGVTLCDPTYANNWNSKNPFVPCGYTNSLGNTTGVVAINLPTGYNSETGRTQYVPSWRGLENPFGHIYKLADGIKFNNHTVYRTNDQSKYSSSASQGNYENKGAKLSSGTNWVTKLLIGDDGDISPTAGGGSSTSYYAVYHYKSANTTDWYCCQIGGMNSPDNAHHEYYGLGFMSAYNLITYSSRYTGTRLCYCDR